MTFTSSPTHCKKNPPAHPPTVKRLGHPPAYPPIVKDFRHPPAYPPTVKRLWHPPAYPPTATDSEIHQLTHTFNPVSSHLSHPHPLPWSVLPPNLLLSQHRCRSPQQTARPLPHSARRRGQRQGRWCPTPASRCWMMGYLRSLRAENLCTEITEWLYNRIMWLLTGCLA